MPKREPRYSVHPGIARMGGSAVDEREYLRKAPGYDDDLKRWLRRAYERDGD